MSPPGGLTVSVVVRSRNEAAHLGGVLRAVRDQRTSRPVQVIAVDNRSDDGSRQIAAELADVCLDIDQYRPGAALNAAIEIAEGDLIVALSGHAIPADAGWLDRLTAPAGEKGLAGAYGAQRYCDNARFLDKKDLDIFRYGPPRVERADSDFWNANSFFTRQAWSRRPFDEHVFELEDHHWTKELLPRGFHVRYEPAARVYHYGHYKRNDRVLPGCPDDDETLAAATAVLGGTAPSWPERMDAVLRVKTLAHRVTDTGLIDRLRVMVIEDEDFDVRWRVADALSRFPTAGVARTLAQALDDPSFYVRDEAAWSLARLGRLGVEATVDRLGSLPAPRRHLVALALAGSGIPAAVTKAVALVGDDLRAGSRHHLDALYVAGELGGTRHAACLVPEVVPYLTATEPAVARTACWALGVLTAEDHGRDVLEPVAELAQHHEGPEVRAEATTAILRAAGARRNTWARKALSDAAADDDGSVRFSAIHGARRLAEQGHNLGLAPRPDDPDFGVRFESKLLAEALAGV